jgi:hypothetical protein
MSVTLLELLNYALELDRAEEVAGPGHPQLYLWHQERSRVANRIQHGLQTQGSDRPWLVCAVSARIGGSGAWEGAVRSLLLPQPRWSRQRTTTSREEAIAWRLPCGLPGKCGSHVIVLDKQNDSNAER